MSKVGYISSVNYETGMVRVLYKGSDKVSKEITYLSNGEYRMPNKDDMVLIETGTDGNAVCLGTTFNARNKPEKHGKGYYFKKFNDICSMEATDTDIIFSIGEKSISIKDVIDMIEKKNGG